MTRSKILTMPDGPQLAVPATDEMTLDDMLTMLKVDLGITAEAYDDRLKQYIQSAIKAITDEGIELDFADIEHVQLVVMYAGWQWRKRDTGEGMPRMVRYQMHNLIIHQHIGDENGRRNQADSSAVSS